MAGKQDVAKPLSRYAPFRRAGDLVIFAGITAADPDRGIVIRGTVTVEHRGEGQLWIEDGAVLEG